MAAGYVLAGGRSSRMGRNKALLELAGQTLLERSLHILQSAGLSAAIAGGAPELERFAPLLPDAQPDLGPLSGIAAALAHCPAPYAVFLSVDLPLLPPALLRVLLERARSHSAPVALAALQGFVESFPAVLGREVLPALTAALGSPERGCLGAFRRAAQSLGRAVEVVEVEPLASDLASPFAPATWFLNLNRAEDFALARQHISAAIP